MAQIAIIGGGAWGKALYHALSQKNTVCIVSRRPLDHTFDQVHLQEALKRSSHAVIAISSDHLRDFLTHNPFHKEISILVAAKGIEEHSGALVNEIMETFFPSSSLAYLGGPSFAAEVAQSLPCAVAVHSYSEALAKQFQAFFPVFMRTYTDQDVIGAEIAGAYKNVIAIASGICAGLELGQNAKAALLARGLVEMSRFGVALGAKAETFLGLCGAGDLFLTANSVLSRNYRVGLALAKGENIASIIQKLGEVAEGIKTAKAITILSERHHIYTPIAREVSEIIKGKDAQKSLQDILTQGR